jgi:hypothetical protein
MTRCATCGALLGPDAEWCGQCYAPVRSPRPEGRDLGADASHQAPDLPVSPNGATTAPEAPTVPQGLLSRPALTAAAALAAIPPDLQITLASPGRVVPMSDRAKTWLTAMIALVAVGSDLLFFPYVKYMVVYGILASVLSALAILRLWRRRSVKN